MLRKASTSRNIDVGPLISSEITDHEAYVFYISFLSPYVDSCCLHAYQETAKCLRSSGETI